jgi:predicted RNA binding protein with dsRBD fold (UPF0201 family)
MSELEGSISTTVNPTESIEKVVTAIQNVFGDLELETTNSDGAIRIEGRFIGVSNLAAFRDIISRMRIRDASRSFLSRIIQGDTLSFGLNKQAAFAGSVSFYHGGESPLGPIQVYLRGDVINAVEFLCGKIPMPHDFG